MSFYYPITSHDFRVKTLIVPVVSTANVSQLAADLLIASFALDRIGVFDARHLVPVVGAREGGKDGVTTPLELYGKDGVDIVVIQQRSPALKARKQDFVDALLNFVGQSAFASVIYLAGVDSTNRSDAQMLSPIYYFQAPNTPPLQSSPISDVISLHIPAYTSPSPDRPAQKDSNTAQIPFIAGGGLTRRLLSSLSAKAGSPPAISLLQFAMEGDNRGDARLMAAVVVKILRLEERLEKEGWREPESWRQGLFGTPHESTLYG